MESSNDRFFYNGFQLGEIKKEEEEESEYESRSSIVRKSSKQKDNKIRGRMKTWRKKVKSQAKKLNILRGRTDSVESRPASAQSLTSNLTSGRSSPTLEVIDFIDEDYKMVWRRVRQFHRQLVKIHDQLDVTLKPGPPLGGRLDALKNTFKMGTVGQFPEIRLAKEFNLLCLSIGNNTKLGQSMRDVGDTFSSSAFLRENLVTDARTRFVSPLTEFLTKDWKEICYKDKSLTELATKIQKIKTEAKAGQAEINSLMCDFASRRQTLLNIFDYILRSEVALTQRLVHLAQAYKSFYLENMKIFNGLERSLRIKNGSSLPAPLWLDSVQSASKSLGESRSLPLLPSPRGENKGSFEEQRNPNPIEAEIESLQVSSFHPGHPEHPGHPDPRTLAGPSVAGLPWGYPISHHLSSEGPPMPPPPPATELPATPRRDTVMTSDLMKSGLLPNRTGNGDGVGISGLLSGGGDFVTRGKNIWESKNLTPLKSASPVRTARAYGFCRAKFSPSSGEELHLVVGDLVYIDAKLLNEETKDVWVCGERGGGGRGARAGLCPLAALDVIIDL